MSAPSGSAENTVYRGGIENMPYRGSMSYPAISPLSGGAGFNNLLLANGTDDFLLATAGADVDTLLFSLT